MRTYRITHRTTIEVIVDINAEDEDYAADAAWKISEDYLNTLSTQTGDERIYSVAASLDGIGADEVEEVTA